MGKASRCVWCTALLKPGSSKGTPKFVNVGDPDHYMHFCPKYQMPNRTANYDFSYPTNKAEALTEEQVNEIVDALSKAGKESVKYVSHKQVMKDTAVEKK